MNNKKHHVKIELEKEFYDMLLKIKLNNGLTHNTEAIRLCIKTTFEKGEVTT